MANWQHYVKIKHLFIEEEDHESIQNSMDAIADVLSNELCFVGFPNKKAFRDVPEGDDIFGPVDYANRLLDRLYDFADTNLIWIC